VRTPLDTSHVAELLSPLMTLVQGVEELRLAAETSGGKVTVTYPPDSTESLTLNVKIKVVTELAVLGSLAITYAVVPLCEIDPGETLASIAELTVSMGSRSDVRVVKVNADVGSVELGILTLVSLK
jgi:hypothetical protein